MVKSLETKMNNFAKGVELYRNAHPRKIEEDKTIGIRRKEILDALLEFMECVRYLNTRRSKGTVLALSGEDDVQDALFVMLRPWVKDLRYEEPSPKSTNRYVIPDFVVPSAKMVIEAKYIRDKRHGKEISKELHDDIEMYKQLPECHQITFFIYDPDSYIPSMETLKNGICISRQYNERELIVELIVKP